MSDHDGEIIANHASLNEEDTFSIVRHFPSSDEILYEFRVDFGDDESVDRESIYFREEDALRIIQMFQALGDYLP